MSAKEYLSAIKGLRAQLAFAKAELENYHIDYNPIHGIDYGGDKVQTSPKNSLEEAAWKMLEHEEGWMREIANLNLELDTRLDKIRKLDNPVYSLLLYYRYYEGQSWESVAQRLGLAYKTMKNYHRSALREFDTKYSKSYQKCV